MPLPLVRNRIDKLIGRRCNLLEVSRTRRCTTFFSPARVFAAVIVSSSEDRGEHKSDCVLFGELVPSTPGMTATGGSSS